MNSGTWKGLTPAQHGSNAIATGEGLISKSPGTPTNDEFTKLTGFKAQGGGQGITKVTDIPYRAKEDSYIVYVKPVGGNRRFATNHPD